MSEGTDFGFIPVGVQVIRYFKLTNDGNKPLNPGSASFSGTNANEFSVNGLSLGNLAPGASDEFTITWTPNVSGTRTATFNFVSDDPDENPYTFKLSGTAQIFPNISVAGLQGVIATGINDGDLTPDQEVTRFGNVNVGGTAGSRQFRISNDGNDNLHISSITSSNPSFTIPTPPTLVLDGESADFTILFTPTTPVTVISTITITSDSPGSEAVYTFAVTGNGIAPDARLSGRQGSSGSYTEIPNLDTTPRLTDGTDFSFIPVGVSVSRDFELANTGNAPLDPATALIVGADKDDFAIGGLTYGNLAPGAVRTFTITFEPKGAGTKNAQVQLVSDDPDENPYTFSLTGEALVFPEIEIKGRRLGGVGQTLSEVTDGSTITMQATAPSCPTRTGVPPAAAGSSSPIPERQP